MAEKLVGIGEFRDNLAEFLRQVEHGASLVVTSHGRKVARVIPPAPTGRRVPGALKGRIALDAGFEAVPAGFDLHTEGRR